MARPTYTGGRRTYDGQHAIVGERPTYTGQSTQTEPPKGPHPGFLSRFGSDLLNAAESSVTGAYTLTKDTAATIKDTSPFASKQKRDSGGPLSRDVKAIAENTKETVKHPLRHPGNTALLALPLAGQVAKLGEAAALAKAGGTAGEVAKAATVGAKAGPRELHVGDLKVRGHYSKSAGARVVQKSTDTFLESAPAGSRRENLLHRRAAKWNQRNERVMDAVHRAPGTQVQALGAKLKPQELRALRLVAEEVPVERRIAAQELRKTRAKDAKETARHQERIDLNKGAQAFLTSDASGKPQFRPEATKLKRVYNLMEKAVGSREEILKNLNLLDSEGQQAAKTKVAKIAAGGRLDKEGNVVGADGVKASKDALFVGNPVERTKMLGKPKVSSTGTFGHTRKLPSLKTMTGGAAEHALERNDVTNIVAERHSEAVRLSKLQRVASSVAKAGTSEPVRPNDVWVWTDKTVSNERIPKEVRRYLDNPEAIRQLPADEQVSVMDKIRQAHFEERNWKTDPTSRAEFENLAKQGKGVFVPRRLLGQFAKREEITLPGTKYIDAVNNAQKAGLVYLKVNYPLIQAMSNTAMNLVQQGFAFPRNITRAVRLDAKLGPEYAAVVDDIMGQGAVVQAQFEGQGAVAKATQKIGHVMSSKVDTPARRAAFLHEAARAGYKTPEQIRALLEDPQHVGDLVEVAQRAKEAIVDYGEMSPFEKSVVRRLIFVYPWQKGATKYAAHFLRDHPVQAAAIAQLGQYGAQINQQKLGDTPTYLRGSFDVGGGLVNPAGVNFFQTPGQIGEGVAGTLTGNPAQVGAGLDFLAPAPALLAGVLSGRDSLGRPLKGNALAKARDLTLAQTPGAALVRAALGGNDVVRKAFGSKTSSQTFPNPNDAFYRFLLGGLYPRQYSKPALNQNASLEKTGR